MINEIKDVMTSYNLNPQQFNNVKCKIHPDQYVTHVILENNHQNKLLCSGCILKEQELDQNSAENTKKSSQVIEYKTFLKNLYLYCTLEDNDPERFSSEIVKCLDGSKQPEKLKLYTNSASQIKSELKKEFSAQLSSKFDALQKEITQQIDKTKITLNNYIDQQLDLIFSRETLQIKQFKERGCNVILQAAKNVVQQIGSDQVSQFFESISTAINRLHSGKVELSYAQEHSTKVYKSFLQEFDKKIKQETLESVQKIISKNILDIQSTHHFLPKKSTTSLSTNLNLNLTQNDLKTKKESICSISEIDKIDLNKPVTIQNITTNQHISVNSVESIKKNNSSNFIIKPIPQLNGNAKREQYLTPKYKFSEDNITLQQNSQQEKMNTLTDGSSPKNAFLKHNNNRRLSKDEQFNKLQNSTTYYTPTNHQKTLSQQESIFKDNNFLSNQNQQNINNKNKQATSTSLFSSFSSTLRTKSSTSIPMNQQQFSSIHNAVSSGIESTHTNTSTQQSAFGPDKFLKIPNQLKSQNQIKSNDTLQSQQQLQNAKGNDELTDRDSYRYYIGQSSSNGLSQFQKRYSHKSDLFSPFTRDSSEKNINLTNNSQFNTKEQIDNDSEYTQVSRRRQTTKLNTYTNQDNSIQGNGSLLSLGTSPSQSSSALGSRMKNNIVKSVLISNTTKQINQDNLKHSKEIISEKPFKYNLLSIVRIPNQTNYNESNLPSQSLISGSRKRRLSLEQHWDSHNNPSNSPPKDISQNVSNVFGSSGKIDDIGNFLLASPDGYLSLFNVQGKNLNQIYRERTHVKLNSIAIGSTGGMFFTAGEQSQMASIKLWIFHSQQRFSELVELKMADSNIKKIFFIKEEYASRLNKLNFAIWTQTKTEQNKSENKKQNEQEQQTVDKIEIWNLEFTGNKFEGAKMFNISSVELPANTLNVFIKDDEIAAYTKDTLTLYSLMNNNSSIHKKCFQKFINIIKQDTILCVRQYQQCKNSTKNSFVFTQQGQVTILNDHLNIIQEKGVKDKSSKHITLEDAIFYEQECDLTENRRFLNFFKKNNKTLYVFDLETLKIVDELQSYDEIKNIFFYGQGNYLGFEQYYVRVWKPLPQKQQIMSSNKMKEDD